MKALYAFKQSQSSDFHLGVDIIQQKFEPDYMLELPPDEKQLLLDAQTAIELYKKYHQEAKPAVEEEVGLKIKNATLEAIKQFHKSVSKDKEHHLQEMLAEVEQIYDQYLSMLMLLVKVSDVAAEEFKIKQERNMSGNAVFPYQYKFATNKLVNLIREDNELSKLVARRRVRLDDDFVRTAYRVLKSHAPYQSYAEAISSDFQTDKLICEEIVKEVFFKHEVIFQVYEEENINWEENRSSLRSMVLKTIKNLEENQTIVLLDLSKNWTDDRNFFIDCYTNTLENENVYEKYISSHLKNWDLERVALVDKVILEMALSEMFNCPSIPIKVTINEYVELAKNYSTPKSKEFVNGILDVLSKELTEKGIIRKSGRGLLDNQ